MNSPQMTPPINYVCVHECGEGSEKIGLFQVLRGDPANNGWVLARIPSSWGRTRSSRLIPPDADGQIELPNSLFPEVKTKAQVLKYFKPAFTKTSANESNNNPATGTNLTTNDSLTII